MHGADDDVQPIVMDIGGQMSKAGFAEEDAPCSVFPSVVGRSQHDATISGLGGKEFLVGDACQSKMDILSMQSPMEHGIVTNWDTMEKIWNHIFYNELKVNPADRPVLLNEAPLNPKVNRERMIEVMFEVFNVPGCYVADQYKLSLYSCGRPSGILCECGDGVSYAAPIYEGYCEPQAIRRMDFAGRDLTSYLQKMLMDNGYSFASFAETEIVRCMKEKICYTALDYQSEMSTKKEMKASYQLPDGNHVNVGNARFRCPEALFQPSLMGIKSIGFHEMIYESLMKCQLPTRPDLFVGIILTGGSTMFPGFKERLQAEMTALLPRSMKVRVVAPPERKYSIWIGGSILASLTTFQKKWNTKLEYEEHGPSIVHRQRV